MINGVAYRPFLLELIYMSRPNQSLIFEGIGAAYTLKSKLQLKAVKTLRSLINLLLTVISLQNSAEGDLSGGLRPDRICKYPS